MKSQKNTNSEISIEKELKTKLKKYRDVGEQLDILNEEAFQLEQEIMFLKNRLKK